VGRCQVQPDADGARHRAFVAALLRDLEALDRMIDGGLIESGVRRIGVEQEVVLVDSAWRPSPRGLDVVSHIRDELGDERVTSELARFNAEANLPPVRVGPGMLGDLERELNDVMGLIGRVGLDHDCRPVLAGIVPTVELRDLGMPNITPNERYRELDRVIREMRGREYELSIKGCDELCVQFPSIMLEALNTSFQVHLQVSAEEFPAMYNTAQLLAAPILAASANSPLLLGKRLWRETRIAIFQQAVDTRRLNGPLREMPGRVRFGEGWIRESVSEVFRTDIARFRLFFAGEVGEDPIAALDEGRAPALNALATHNGTVYRWNRACYGRTEGRPHLRIENRYLPAGPTTLDEVANTALWVGAMLGGVAGVGNPADLMSFDDVSNNFLRAARQGLDTNLVWLDGKSHTATALLQKEIIPMAREGLAGAGLSSAEIDRYLGVIEGRVATGRTGARWQVESFNSMIKRVRRGRAVVCLTAGMARRAESGKPVHLWEAAGVDECDGQSVSCARVGQFMSTNLFTVRGDELVDLVLHIMDWQQIRHVLVEDAANRVVGIISWRQVLAFLADPARRDAHAAASDIMNPDPITGTPDMTACEAIALLREHEVSALPIVEAGRLVGVVTEHDFARMAGELLEERRGKDTEPSA
jgi:CBS domain-containing protein